MEQETGIEGKGADIQAAVPAAIIAEPEKKVAIVGCSDSKKTAPYDDPTWDIWAMNNAFAHIHRQHTWFEIHPIKFENGKYLRRKLIRPGMFEWATDFRGQNMTEYMGYLAALDCPVYMQQHWDIIPKSVPYPLQEVIARFGRYFTNSVSYMIVLAIMQGYKEIGCWGVDMATGCPAPDVRVLKADLQWTRADSLNVGDEVLGFDENSNGPDEKRKWRKSIVTACPTIKKPCYHLTLEDGTEMVVSAKHGWLIDTGSNNKWARMENVIAGNTQHGRFKPAKLLKVVDTWENPTNREQGYLAGAFDSEGHLSQKPHKHDKGFTAALGFSQRTNAMSRAVEGYLTQQGFQYGKDDRGNGFATYDIKGGRASVLRFLGENRPPRLLAKFNPDLLGEIKSKDHVDVVKMEYIGEQDVIGLETTTKTFIAEGFMSHNSEYGPQRPSCEFFLGIAAGLGIRITIPDTADLLKSRFLYGFEEREQDLWAKKVSSMLISMQQRQQKAMNQLEMSRKQVDQYIGAVEAVREISRVWSNLSDEKIWNN